MWASPGWRYRFEDEEIVSDFVIVSNSVPKIPEFPSSSLILALNTVESRSVSTEIGDLFGICGHWESRVWIKAKIDSTRSGNKIEQCVQGRRLIQASIYTTLLMLYVCTWFPVLWFVSSPEFRYWWRLKPQGSLMFTIKPLTPRGFLPSH